MFLLKKCLNSDLSSIFVVQGSFSTSLDLYISRSEFYCCGKLIILAAISILMCFQVISDPRFSFFKQL